MRQLITQSGFSLLELILVIVLLGVLASGAGLLITKPIEAYNDQLRRQQLVDQAEMSLRQIARDIRKALPNSIRVRIDGSRTGLEMINTVDGARYRDEADGLGGPFTTANELLDFTAADTDFNLLGRFTRLTSLAASHRIVIYNTAPTDIYQDVTANNSPGIVTPGSASLTLTLNGDEHHININNVTPFQFSQQSPGQRAYVIDGSISYICDPSAGTLTRYDNYVYQSTQQTSDMVMAALPGAQSGLVVSRLAACTIQYNAGTAQRGGIVTIQLSLDDVSGESISLLHQVHVINVP